MADEIPALEKHACPACGAQAEWDPGKEKLVCPFCGTESAYAIDRATGKVVELDLMAALRTVPKRDEAWQSVRRSVKCQSCHAVMLFDAARVGQNCEFCGSPALVAYDEIQSPIRPQGVLPFRIDRNKVRDSMRRWWRTKWFAPGRLSRAALVDTVKSLYIPYWTFDARARCDWTAEAGHFYYVNVEGSDSQGRSVVRRERRVRWEPAAGLVDHAFDDDLVPGTQGLPMALLRQVEPFPTQDVVAYDTAFLAGHVVEHYKVALAEAAQQSEQQMYAMLEALCARQIPGDTYRNLRIHPIFADRTFKHVLVPVWLLTYTYGPRSYQVIANGFTGTLAGNYPLSVWKVVLAILAAIILVLVVIAVNN